jgi:hypothetical protein
MCDGHDNGDLLDRLAESVERLVAGPPPEVTPFQLGERLIRLRHLLDLLELRFAREAAAFAATEEAVMQGSTSSIDWVRHQCRMSGSAAARSIATGESADLPCSPGRHARCSVPAEGPASTSTRCSIAPSSTRLAASPSTARTLATRAMRRLCLPRT